MNNRHRRRLPPLFYYTTLFSRIPLVPPSAYILILNCTRGHPNDCKRCAYIWAPTSQYRTIRVCYTSSNDDARSSCITFILNTESLRPDIIVIVQTIVIPDLTRCTVLPGRTWPQSTKPNLTLPKTTRPDRRALERRKGEEGNRWDMKTTFCCCCTAILFGFQCDTLYPKTYDVCTDNFLLVNIIWGRVAYSFWIF